MVKKKPNNIRVVCGNCKNYFPAKIPEVTNEDRINAMSKAVVGLCGVLIKTPTIICPYCSIIYRPGRGDGRWFAEVTVELEVEK
jgi:hypothetical protein